MAEEKYVFHDDDEKENKAGFKSKLDGFLQFVWNSRTKEFLGRDGASWAKVSLFYGIFYLILGGFFIGMLSVFFYLTPIDKPTYYGASSIMNSRTATLNPGLGFRPQIDPEDNLIKYNPLVAVDKDFGRQSYVANLNIFLKQKYSKQEGEVENCPDALNSSVEIANQGKSCKFDQEELFKNSPCTEAKEYGYATSQPCVLIKLNKIVSWIPESPNNTVVIQCFGENAFDKDNLAGVKYYSENGADAEGHILKKHFPYNGQKNYRAPFVWAQLTVKPNTLVNIECAAFASNIENERFNRRGITKFALFVQNGAAGGKKREL